MRKRKSCVKIWDGFHTAFLIDLGKNMLEDLRVFFHRMLKLGLAGRIFQKIGDGKQSCYRKSELDVAEWDFLGSEKLSQ